VDHPHLLAVSLVTLGSPTQLTGGYLYHQRMAEAAPDHDARWRFVSFPDLAVLPFPLATVAAVPVWRRAADGADVVLVDSIAAAFLAPAVAGRRPRPPVVTVAHQPPGGIDHGRMRAAVQARLDCATYRRCALIIAASQALADEMAALELGPPIDVVPPGCDSPETEAAAGDQPSADLRQGRRVAFLSVGNWVRRKGTLALLEAFARLPEDAATLHLAGRDDVEPAYADQVWARIRSPELRDRVVVHGAIHRAEVDRLYRAADVFVLPSEREPYGTVYGEAMAAGLPVVGWRAGNLPHLARDGTEGVILPPGDIEGLTTALGRLVGDDAWRARLAEGARRRGATLPTWAESAKRFFGLLREVRGAR
jgi:glycosyltransferase involved in cell wall biosynthesis